LVFAGNGRKVVDIWLIGIIIRQDELERLSRVIIEIALIHKLLTSMRRMRCDIVYHNVWMRLTIILLHPQLRALASLFAYDEVSDVHRLPVRLIEAEFLNLEIILCRFALLR
jgi:hypothetical protein